MEVTFLGVECTVKFYEYDCNGRTAIKLVDSSDGTPVLTASVNLPDSDIPDGYVAIKDYSENEGVLEGLIKAGILRKSCYVKNGCQRYPVCQILKTE